jgi:hypothetical protein
MSKTVSMPLWLLLMMVVACNDESPNHSSGSGGGEGTAGGGGASSSIGSGSSNGGASGTSETVGTGGFGVGEGGGAGATTAGSGGGGSGGSGSAIDAGSGPDASAVDGGINAVPPDYKGKPFMKLQIPGTIHLADYDLGGAGVAYCHGNPNDCAAGIKMNDWCCGPGKGCDQRNDPACPPYRPDSDNAGLCHMNVGEPDNTTTGQTYAPYYPYLCYMATGEWVKYTVQVAEAGTYSIGGAMAVPPGTSISLDFGNGIGTGTFMLPASPTAMCRCPESYHSWETVTGLAAVTFASPGTYVMTMKLVSQQFNPEYFAFTKM